MNKRCFFSIADNRNLPYFKMMEASLRKFDKTTPLILIDEAKIKQLGDPHFFYRSTPIITKALMKDYNMVCHIDADVLVLGNLDHVWEGDYDLAVTYNSNPRDDAKYPIRLLDIHPYSYCNNGFNVFKSKAFIDQWLKLCMSDHFLNFQYREQDLLNILIYYFSEPFGGPYKVKFLDNGPKWHNLASKGYTPYTKMVDGKVILPKSEEWPKEDKQLVAYHFAGGFSSAKMKYRLIFPNDVIQFIDNLVKP